MALRPLSTLTFPALSYIANHRTGGRPFAHFAETIETPILDLRLRNSAGLATGVKKGEREEEGAKKKEKERRRRSNESLGCFRSSIMRGSNLASIFRD